MIEIELPDIPSETNSKDNLINQNNSLSNESNVAITVDTHSTERGVYIGVSTDENNNIWQLPLIEGSLPEYNGNIKVNEGRWYYKMLSFVGPGAVVSVGYMDPGNWSTDVAGGSQFGYALLFFVLLSSFMAMFLQFLSLKAGLATQRDLAQICRDSYPQYINTLIWIVMEIAIAATDLAEVLGSAIALNILTGLPIIYGALITCCDIFLFLMLNGSSFRYIEVFVGILITFIACSLAAEIGLCKANSIDVLLGYLPSKLIFANQEALFNGIGIIGATVMPHNLFLHSSIVLTRKIERDDKSVQEAINFGLVDSTVSLSFATFVNSSILILAAATFHKNGYNDVASLEDAYKLLTPLLKNKAAPILFGLSLLAAGQNSTLTGTLTGQIVMEGFMNLKISPNLRRIVTRSLAIVPSIIAIAIGGNQAANTLLIFSQVILSFALPFAVIPLAHITSSKERMGIFVNNIYVTIIAWSLAIIISGLNIYLLSTL